MSISVCPKCQAPRQNGNECPACGVIYAKAEQADRERQALAAAAAEKAARQQAAIEEDRAKAVARQLAKLNACKTCGAAIAKTASACPHCGAKQPRSVGKLGLTLAAAFTVVYVINIYNHNEQKTASGQNVAKQSDSESNSASRDGLWIIQNQDLIKQKLRDPESAQFKDTIVSRRSGSPIVCGLVNGKNAFGGYAGFQRFISAGQSIQILESDMAAGEMNIVWLRFC